MFHWMNYFKGQIKTNPESLWCMVHPRRDSSTRFSRGSHQNSQAPNHTSTSGLVSGNIHWNTLNVSQCNVEKHGVEHTFIWWFKQILVPIFCALKSTQWFAPFPWQTRNNLIHTQTWMKCKKMWVLAAYKVHIPIEVASN